MKAQSLFLLGAVITGCGAPAGPKAPRVSIVYTNNVDGEIEPCG